MAYILSIESSGEAGSVALHKAGVLLSSDIHIESNSHSNTLALQVNRVLDKAKVAKEELLAVAISAGPGSYTGLRIGASLAKGICFGLNIPLIGVSSLQVLSAPVLQSLTEQEVLFCTFDARRNEVYGAVVDKKNEFIIAPEAFILPHAKISSLMDSKGMNFKVLELGVPKVGALLGLLPDQVLATDWPKAENMGMLAYTKFMANDFLNLVDFQPWYLKEAYITQVKSMFGGE